MTNYKYPIAVEINKHKNWEYPATNAIKTTKIVKWFLGTSKHNTLRVSS